MKKQSPAKRQNNAEVNGEKSFYRHFGFRPVITVDSDRRLGPFYLDVQLPTTAGDVSFVSDDALYGDPNIRQRWAPANGTTTNSQSVALHVETVELIVWDSDLLLQAAAVLDDLYAANVHLYFNVQGQQFAHGLFDHIRTPFSIANNSNATAGGYPRKLETRGPLVLPVPVEVNPKLGDTAVVRTDANLTAALDCKLRVTGYAYTAGNDDGTDARGPFSQGCDTDQAVQSMSLGPQGQIPGGAYRQTSVELVTLA